MSEGKEISMLLYFSTILHYFLYDSYFEKVMPRDEWLSGLLYSTMYSGRPPSTCTLSSQ
jgi:hypothetical protein